MTATAALEDGPVLLGMFHLRRVQFQTFVKEKSGRPSTDCINDGLEPVKDAIVMGRSTMVLLDKQTKIGRNPELVDVVLHSVVHSNMISRDHSLIVGEHDEKGRFMRYFISDRSLNGTYVNDTRVKDLQQLKEGDLVKFGHVNGAAIKAGEYAPQQSAEFIFRFERALPNYNYFGYTPKGARIQSEHRRAYMQINSDRVLPTEVYSSATLAAAAVQKPSLPSASGPTDITAVNNSAGIGPRTASISSIAAVNSSSNNGHPSHPSSSSVTSTTATGGALPILPSNANHPQQHQQSHSANQLAHLAAVAAATTAVTSAAQAAVQQHPPSNQQQQAFNALNQLGLGAATEEQVTAMNAQLRSLMASHDAMTAMERLAAQQQWQKSILNLNSLQQQNPLIYGHAFPAAAAAAAALFTGIGGLADLNSAAIAANPTAAAAQYAAVSLWPNIRATLQPTATQQAEWSQQQQKAAALAQQLQLRLPGANLYQPPQQAMPAQQNPANAQTRVGSAVTVASSLFGAPSAFSLPGTNQQQSIQQQTSNRETPSTSSAAVAAAAAAGLLIAAHPGGSQHQHPSISSSSAAYSSCTSSQPPGIRPASLSRGASSSSLASNLPPTTSSSADTLTAARMAAAQLAKEALEADQAKATAAAGWPHVGISCTSASNSTTANSKVSPIVAAAAAAARMPASAFQGTPSVAVSSAQLQRIPGIASALAAAVAVAQQQQQVNTANNAWPPGGTPPIVPTPSVTPAIATAQSVASMAPTHLVTPPTIQQPLAQRLLFTSSNNSSISLSGGSKSSSSSSGISSEASSSGSTGTLLLSPNALSGAKNDLQNSHDSLSSSACTSSLNNSGTNSAFSTPLQNNTSLSTLTAAIFAAEKVAKHDGIAGSTREESTDTTKDKRRMPTMVAKREKSSGSLNFVTAALTSTIAAPQLNLSNGSLSADLDQLQIENKKSSSNTAEGMPKNESGRQLMECDSSVPSPPSKQQQEEEDEMLPRSCSSLQQVRDNNSMEKADPITRKRHSNSNANEKEGQHQTQSTKTNGDEMDKPRPVKHARKSNEVARLLNDLTAGNCSWQYMAERQQQRTVLTTKSKTNNKNMPNKAGKKPLRLDERKQLEIEKKKTHKMMRQISDSESSGDEHQQKDRDITAESEDEGSAKGDKVSAKEKNKQSRKSSSGSSSSIPTFRFSSPNGWKSQDEDEHDGNSSADSDDTNHRQHSTKAGPTASNANGSAPVNKRKLLSSAPTNKNTTATTNGSSKTQVKEQNGKPEIMAAKKRGPKPVEEKKRGASSAGRTRKNTAGSTNSATAPATGGLQKRGRKAGVGRGRKPTKETIDSDDDDDAKDNNTSDVESDSGDDRRVLLNVREKTTTYSGMNGGGEQAKPKRGRKAGTISKKKASAMPSVETTVMEDWTGGTGDPEKCAHSRCKRPKDMSINWVQCDKCDQWFHSSCVFGDNSLPDDEKWFCTDCQPNGGAGTSRNPALHPTRDGTPFP